MRAEQSPMNRPLSLPTCLVALVAVALAGCATRPAASVEPVVISTAPVRAEQVKRVSTAVPFPRGLHLMDDKLYVLARGRVRESGGADGRIDDRAGTIFVIDPNLSEPIVGEPSPVVRDNAAVFAEPTEPPFKLFDRSANPPTRDRETDRPYCSLRYDPATKNFFLCAFSGIDKPEGQGSTFSKNTGDALHRFDTRTGKWHVVEKHNIEAGGSYPHHDPHACPPPHGWLNGPDNCLAVGRWLYAVAKDNSTMVRYDLSELAANPDAGPPPSFWVLGDRIDIVGKGMQSYQGHSMLAQRDGWLYIGYRTSSVIARVRLDRDGLPVQPIRGELIAVFDPFDPQTRKSANLTDMVFGPDGDLYVISAQPSKVYRFRPDPSRVFDGRSGKSPPWADLSALTANPRMKSENVLVDDRGGVFVTSGDAYSYQAGSGGTVYRIDP